MMYEDSHSNSLTDLDEQLLAAQELENQKAENLNINILIAYMRKINSGWPKDEVLIKDYASMYVLWC